MKILSVLLVWGVTSFAGPHLLANEDTDRFFENEIRPILVERCASCHGKKKQESGLRVDSRDALIKGGETGAAIVPGDVAASLLIQAVRREGDLAMPPETALSAREVKALEQWIKLDAPWPASVPTLPAPVAKEHWAFQPVRQVEVPDFDANWIRTPVDAFVFERLRQASLTPSAPADRRTLIRRAYYSLTGLPPSPDEVDRFVNDTNPQAYEQLVDRLLDSSHYGEHWARHWLDVARYSDTKGYVYAREERFWVHAWAYRDWVVRALNDDLPYDRFLLLQLAADQVANRAEGDLAAMGFLTLGRRFLGVKHDIIDDRIDVVCRGTMGLAVGCARCHDHKYDPIPTADYYSLHGVFDSCAERLVPLAESGTDEAFDKELAKRRENLQQKLLAFREESASRVRGRIADYLKAQMELEKYPADGFDQIFAKSDLLPAFVRRWETYLRSAKLRNDPVFAAWHAYVELPADSFASAAFEATKRLQDPLSETINPIVAGAFAEPPKSFQEVIDRYAAIFTKIDADWQATLAAAKLEAPKQFANSNAEELRRVLYGANAPCEVPDEPVVHTETFFDSASCTELWKLQGEVDRWIIRSKMATPFALTLVDRPLPVEPRILRRGNPLNKGERVPRQFLAVLAGDARKPFRHGSGRLELAEAIINPANPLTARVIVNRVWTYHFGQGLVTTPSDFGTRAEPPSHPDLLDWLATQFVAEGWNLKKLHRWIMTSSTYRQTATGPADTSIRRRALAADPDNRLLWRMNQHRLTFEEFRDSLLAVSNELNPRVGGKPAEIFTQPYPKRRSIYGLVDRQFLPGTLRMFDFANPDLHIPQRSETTVPQQALFFMNHPIVLERARALAELANDREVPSEKVAVLFKAAYQRQPSESEIVESLELIAAAENVGRPSVVSTAADWRYGYGAFDEAAKRVLRFTALPHFTGTAWQGGPQWPDSKLGWVQLTAAGGHPGNDRQHAAIRRWTAPRSMAIAVRSQLVHEPAVGDGVRAFIISSRAGVLESAAVHQKSLPLNVDSLDVEKGETIDFVVDIGDVLNSDQYLWEVTVQETANAASPSNWNSRTDFPRDEVNRLNAWEQLAQVLLCANEFLFID